MSLVHGWVPTGTGPVEQWSTIVLPTRPHSAECSLLGVSLRATCILQRMCRRRRHHVGQPAHLHLSPKPSLETGTACSMQNWLGQRLTSNRFC